MLFCVSGFFLDFSFPALYINTPIKYSKYEFELNFGQLNAQRRMSMPQGIVSAVVRGVLSSDLVAERIKKQLR